MSGQPSQRDSISAGVAAILARTARVDQSAISGDSRLRDGFGIDSLTMIDLVVAVEDEFAVRIPDEDAEHFETMGDIVSFISQAKTAA